VTRAGSWALAIGAGALAAGADVVMHAVRVPHFVASAVAALLFFGAGRLGRSLAAAAGGGLLHGLLDGVWLVRLLGLHAGLSYAAVTAGFDLVIDLLAASLGARRAGAAPPQRNRSPEQR